MFHHEGVDSFMKAYRYMISGPGDSTKELWEELMKPRIDVAIAEEGSSFLIGDFTGCDAYSRRYLATVLPSNEKDRVTIYHMFNRPRHGASGFQMIGGFENDEERDSAMTRNSDRDITLVLPGRENRGCARNLIRREMMHCSILGRSVWDVLAKDREQKRQAKRTKRAA